MNQEKFATFSAAYRVALEAAVTANPEDYVTRGATPSEYARVVGDRMLGLIASGKHMGINYDSDGFKRTCKALGIKFTRKAMLAYLEIAT